ncbi:MAG: D-2-hydroxyacid dehydrogenase [Defluviitaleaceae bacterium]|nr:D-2-hydroxyacid dehydrogenase [Defluviitaleaceae bacterium]
MKIVVLDGYTENPGDLSWEGFEKLGKFIVYDRVPHQKDEIINKIDNADAVITNKVPITQEIIAACPSIKYIGLLSTGYNVVDIEAAKAKGIPVTNIPAYGTDTVAQFTIGLLLEICLNIGHHNAEVVAGRWEKSIDFCFWDYPQIELAGKTMGIIGYGNIGKATGQIASALGMKVIANNKSAKGKNLVSLDELLAQSDVISLHCPLTPENEKLINKETIAKMKDGVIILNTARGALVDEKDLADALNSGKVYAAGVDVVSVEPIKKDNPLLKARNCYITPHIAWAAKEARARLMNIAVENLKAFIDGKPINVVNKPVS